MQHVKLGKRLNCGINYPIIMNKVRVFSMKSTDVWLTRETNIASSFYDLEEVYLNHILTLVLSFQKRYEVISSMINLTFASVVFCRRIREKGHIIFRHFRNSIESNKEHFVKILCYKFYCFQIKGSTRLHASFELNNALM